MKLMIFLGITITSMLGGWLGEILSHGNWLSGWSLLLGTLGAFPGIWLGYKVARYLEL